jgi:hypothetical protein
MIHYKQHRKLKIKKHEPTKPHVTLVVTLVISHERGKQDEIVTTIHGTYS